VQNIRSWKPKLLVVAHVAVDQNSPFFLNRVKELVQFYSCRFDMLECMSKDGVLDMPRARLVVEKGLWGREIIHGVACEGTNRVGRDEKVGQWRERLQRIGFKEFPSNPVTLRELRDQAKLFHPNFDVFKEGEALCLAWRDLPLTAVQAWTC
jgi:hypothetical protein